MASAFRPSPVLRLERLEDPTRRDDLDGDNWPVTWAADDAVYAAYGDGWGPRPIDPRTKRNTGLVRLLGTDGAAEEVPCPWFGAGAEDPNLKGCGLLAAGGVIHHFLRFQVGAPDAGGRPTGRRQVASRLIWSSDGGATWQGATDYGPDPDRMAWFFGEADHAFHSPTFLQAGRDYTAAPDDHVYLYSPREDGRLGNDALVLARVRVDRITDRAAYRFFSGVDGVGRALWEERLERRAPVLLFPGRVSPGDVVYLPYWRRYLLATCGARELWLLDAPAPWGPWSTVGHVAPWGSGEGGDLRYDPRLPVKWLAEDASSGVLVYSDRRTPSDKWNAQAFRLRAAAPRSVGSGRLRLDAFADAIMARDTDALVVMEADAERVARYAPDWGPDRPHGTASLAKTLAGAMGLVAAMAAGRLAPEDRAADHVAAWRDAERGRISVRQLADHTSGLDDAEEGGRPHDRLTGWKGRFWRRDPDPFRVARDEAEMVSAPGTRFLYSNPGNAMLAYCLGSALRGSSSTPDLRALLREGVLGPIGVDDAGWSIGYDGPTLLDGLTLYATWGGAAFTAPATAAVGLLLLHGGQWRGRRVLPPELVRRVMTERGSPRPDPGHPANGLGLWLNVDGAWPELPPDTVVGAGAGHQLLVVIPSRGVVLVRYGRALGAGPDFWAPLHQLILAPLAGALG